MCAFLLMPQNTPTGRSPEAATSRVNLSVCAVLLVASGPPPLYSACALFCVCTSAGCQWTTAFVQWLSTSLVLSTCALLLVCQWTTAFVQRLSTLFCVRSSAGRQWVTTFAQWFRSMVSCTQGPWAGTLCLSDLTSVIRRWSHLWPGALMAACWLLEVNSDCMSTTLNSRLSAVVQSSRCVGVHLWVGFRVEGAHHCNSKCMFACFTVHSAGSLWNCLPACDTMHTMHASGAVCLPVTQCT